MNARRIPMHDTCLLAGSTDERDPVAVEESENEAFDAMVADAGGGFADYVREHDCWTVFQLWHKYGGLPRMNGGFQDDRERDAFAAAFDAVIDGYRAEVEKTQTFRDLAQRIYDAKEAQALADSSYGD